jgi:hypothetical protein
MPPYGSKGLMTSNRGGNIEAIGAMETFSGSSTDGEYAAS